MRQVGALVDGLHIAYRRSTMNMHPRTEVEESQALASRLRALAHPARLRILHALASHDTCQCGEIVRGLPLAQSTVSEHLRILREAGLVRIGSNGPRACYCVDRTEVRKFMEQLNLLLAPIGNMRRGRKARRP